MTIKTRRKSVRHSCWHGYEDKLLIGYATLVLINYNRNTGTLCKAKTPLGFALGPDRLDYGSLVRLRDPTLVLSVFRSRDNDRRLNTPPRPKWRSPYFLGFPAPAPARLQTVVLLFSDKGNISSVLSLKLPASYPYITRFVKKLCNKEGKGPMHGTDECINTYTHSRSIHTFTRYITAIFPPRLYVYTYGFTSCVGHSPFTQPDYCYH